MGGSNPQDTEAESSWESVARPWQRALELAWESYCEGSYGIGAIITDAGDAIVAEGKRRSGVPPVIAHAEVGALSQLSAGVYRNHTIWSTLEPCFMCTAATFHSHVGRIRFAAADAAISGMGKLPDISEWISRRWPDRVGPVGGAVALFGSLLPLLRALENEPRGEIVGAYSKRDPGLSTQANELVAAGTVRQLRDCSAAEAFNEIVGYLL